MEFKDVVIGARVRYTDDVLHGHVTVGKIIEKDANGFLVRWPGYYGREYFRFQDLFLLTALDQVVTDFKTKRESEEAPK
jgi:hypothetical protein